MSTNQNETLRPNPTTEALAEEADPNSSQNLIYIQITHASKPYKWVVVHPRSSKKDGKEELVLAPVSPAPVPKELIWLRPIVLGTKIYILPCCYRDYFGANADYFSDVWVLNCRSNTWDQAPNMVVPRNSAQAGVIDGKLYVVGGEMTTPCSETGASHFAEVFDPVIGCWELIPVPFEFQENIKPVMVSYSSVECDRIWASCEAGIIVFNPGTNRWDLECNLEDSGYYFREEFKDWGKEFPWFFKLIMDANAGGRKFLVFSTSDTYGADGELWCAEYELNKSGDGDCGRKLLWVDKIPSLRYNNLTSYKAVLVSCEAF